MQKPVLITAVGVIAIIAIAAVILTLRGTPKVELSEAMVNVAGAKIGGPFTMVRQDGTEVTSEQVIDKPSLIYFGYTFCPDVCPFDVVRNADAADLVVKAGHDLQPVFITVDPERDTVEAVRDYTDAIYDDMLGLTGEPEEIRSVLASYRAVASKAEGEDEDLYLMSHSTLSYLVMPGEGVVAFFQRTLSEAELAERVTCFLEVA